METDVTATPAYRAAETYERFFVAGMFRYWTPLLLQRARPQPGERALDVACGTGVVARSIVPLVKPGGQVVGLDINPAMLAVTCRQFSDHCDEIDWREGEAEDLPFSAGEFDFVTCQQGFQFLRVNREPRPRCTGCCVRAAGRWWRRGSRSRKCVLRAPLRHDLHHRGTSDDQHRDAVCLRRSDCAARGPAGCGLSSRPSGTGDARGPFPGSGPVREADHSQRGRGDSSVSAAGSGIRRRRCRQRSTRKSQAKCGDTPATACSSCRPPRIFATAVR